MSWEKSMRKRVVAALRELDAVSVENGCGVGTPDINFVGGWIETKSMAEWPARSETPLRIEHFTPQQRVWLARRSRAGGIALLLLKVGDDWLLFNGMVAAQLVGFAPKAELFKVALRSWPGGIDEDDLRSFLRACGRA
jgi:hypothetical protein